MKKHDEKKQGIAKSVSSRHYVKERKAKPKGMTNIIGNAWRNKTKPAAENTWKRKKAKSRKKDKRKQGKPKNLYPLPQRINMGRMDT